MKLLPQKKDIDKFKAQERKQEIDTGLALAKSVDKLREARASEEKQLLEYRASMIKKIQYEIDQLIEKKNNLEKQNNEARKLRDELLKPLDNEWKEINQVKKKLGEEQFCLGISREIIDTQLKDIQKERDKLSEIIVKQKQNEQDTIRAKSEVISLKELAQREYEIAKAERNSQTETFEKALSETKQREKEYEVAITTYELKKKEVEEKESELLTDRKHLESQQLALRLAKETIEKNAI